MVSKVAVEKADRELNNSPGWVKSLNSLRSDTCGGVSDELAKGKMVSNVWVEQKRR